jgi:hypothetical protein
MDAFLHFLSQTRRYGSRLFISQSPGPAFLLWCDFANGRRMAGLTLVRQKNGNTSTEDISCTCILPVLKARLPRQFPVLDVVYNSDATAFIIDGKDCNKEEAAKLLAGKLGLRLGRAPAKRPNDPEQINDVFHQWSREVFDGISVRKADIDAILLNENKDAIEALIEIKRSAKNPIGHWTPYMEQTGNTDYWNYIIGLTFSKMVAAHFLTFHHGLMKTEDIFTAETKVELFAFKAPTLVCSETIKVFASAANRKIYSGKDFMK